MLATHSSKPKYNITIQTFSERLNTIIVKRQHKIIRIAMATRILLYTPEE